MNSRRTGIFLLLLFLLWSLLCCFMFDVHDTRRPHVIVQDGQKDQRQPPPTITNLELA